MDNSFALRQLVVYSCLQLASIFSLRCGHIHSLDIYWDTLKWDPHRDVSCTCPVQHGSPCSPEHFTLKS